ncbi:MAG TPA: GcrA family cell cycle regulator [Acetobacteraceae bacterium]|nr:GcrA family cell cycle regulator [Acetobacteraceae bacterium]
MEWNEETIGKLRTLWAEGLSTAEIGRRMGISKNAVVGKAHRLSLPSRPSPIRRDGERSARRRLPRRVHGPTLPALQAAITPLPQEAPRALERPQPVLRAVCLPRPGARSTPCCWPIGEPGTRSFRFCDVDAIPGKPYCDEHASLAYVKVRDRRDEVA